MLTRLFLTGEFRIESSFSISESNTGRAARALYLTEKRPGMAASLQLSKLAAFGKKGGHETAQILASCCN